MRRAITRLRWMISANSGASGGSAALPCRRRSSCSRSKSGMKSAEISNGTEAVRTPWSRDDSMSSAGDCALPRRIQQADLAAFGRCPKISLADPGDEDLTHGGNIQAILPMYKAAYLSAGAQFVETIGLVGLFAAGAIDALMCRYDEHDASLTAPSVRGL